MGKLGYSEKESAALPTEIDLHDDLYRRQFCPSSRFY